MVFPDSQHAGHVRNARGDDLVKVGFAKLRYDPALDGLRAIAIGMVMTYHGFFWRFPGGWAGVDLFFVLSGYLITKLIGYELQQSGSINLPAFYLKRFLRLTPPLVTVLIFVSAVAAITKDWSYLKEIIVSATYTSDWFYAHWSTPTLLGHTWSLSIEEQFYLVWPVLLIVTTIRRSLPVLGCLLVVAILWRGYLFLDHATPARLYYSIDTHADGLIIGCILAAIPVRDKAHTIVICLAYLAAVALGAFCFVGVPMTADQVWEFPMLAALSAFVIMGAQQKGLFRAVLCAPPLVFIGRISYGIYLWHWPLFQYAHKFPHHMSPAIPLGTAVAAAAISYFTVEVPFRRLKSGIGRTRSSSENAAAIV